MAVVGEAQIVVRAVTSGFQRQVQNALRGINAQQAGTNLGQSFTAGFSRSVQNASQMSGKAFRSMSTDATQAADAFKALVIQGYFIGPSLASAAGAIGALAAGLFALGSQIAAALPSLIVLPGILAAIAQAAVAIKFAFSGIGAAFKEITKDSKGAGASSAAANRRIEDAERALARVIERNRETLIRSARDLKDAEDALTKARKDAREELEQLAFDAEDAALSEKKAAIELEKARETLARVQDLPPNSRARREAELAYAEADLNLRRARDRNSDLAKEQEDAADKGVEGSDRVVDAARRYQDAIDAQAKAARDGKRAEADAERDLARAREDAANSGGGAGGTTEFDKLSPAAQRFVEYLKELSERFSALKKQIQEEFFPPFQEGLEKLVKGWMPIIEDILPRTGRAAGEAAKRFAEITTSANFLQNFRDVGETNIYIVERLGDVFGNLASAFVALLDAAGPLIRRFSDWVVTITDGWKNTLEAKNKTGELTEVFDYAGDVAATLGDIIGNLFGGIMNLGKAASGPGSAGEMLLNMFKDSTENFKTWTKTILDDGSAEGYFKRVVPNFMAVMGLIKEIIKQFIRLGDNEGVKGFVDGLKNAVTNLGDIGEKLTDAGPKIGEFIEKFTELIEKFAESGSIQIFFDILNRALDVAIAIFSNEQVAKAVAFVAAVTAVFKAASLLGGVFSFAGQVVDGYITKLFQVGTLIPGIKTQAASMGQAFVTAGGGFQGLAAAFGTSLGVVAGVVAAIAAIAAIVYLAYQNSEIFREAVSKLVDAVGGALSAAFGTILEAIQEVMPAVENWRDVFKEIGDFIGETIVPIIEVLLVRAIEIVGDSIAGLIRTIGGIIKIFQSVWDFIRGIFALFRGDTEKATALFRDSFRRLVDGLKLIFAGVRDIIFAPFRAAFNLVARAWNGSVGKLSWSVPRWVPIIGGNTISAPKIPELAMGGVVYPTAGGALVKVAEAGRPERIEPLDEDGLSKRDRAIISMLSGGKTGQIFNIYPSPGMDERELAAMVSRQLAFQLRAGSV